MPKIDEDNEYKEIQVLRTRAVATYRASVHSTLGVPRTKHAVSDIVAMKVSLSTHALLQYWQLHLVKQIFFFCKTGQ